MQLLLPLFPARKNGKSARRLVVSCANESYEVIVRRTPRARRYTLRVREANRDVVMTMPRRGSLREARDFAERNADWIAAQLKRIPRPVPFVPGAIIPVGGVSHRIVNRRTPRGVWREVADDGIALLCVSAPAHQFAKRIVDFLKREARRELTTATHRYAARLGVRVQRIGLRDTSSRWGSCSQDGRISYSWRLVLAPSFVLDYLAAHEVAHRVELNHSPRFWKVVERLAPDWRRAEAWLKTHGPSLHRYGAA